MLGGVAVGHLLGEVGEVHPIAAGPAQPEGLEARQGGQRPEIPERRAVVQEQLAQRAQPAEGAEVGQRLAAAQVQPNSAEDSATSGL